MKTEKEINEAGSFIVGFIVFACAWIYCISKYGFLLGVGLGWLPALIVGAIAGACWVLIVGIIISAIFIAFTMW